MVNLKKEDFKRYSKELLFLHKKNIEAHLKKDVDSLVQGVSEDFISVNNGKVNFPSIEDIRKNYSEYLENTEFSKYEDQMDPIIGFSEDGSIGWSIVKVSVGGKSKNKHDLEFTCAWITIYKRSNDKWLRFIEVSSFQ